MNKDRFRLALQQEESCNLKRHEVQGIDHIGWGINLETPLPDEILDYLGVEDEEDIDEITEEQADYLLDHFIDIAVDDCRTIFGETWDALTDLRREVLASLSYNLGIVRLKAFRKMIKAVNAGDWAEASRQMLDSKAARQQAPARYKRLASTFEHDDESYLELPNRFDLPQELSNPKPYQVDTPLAGATTQELLTEIARRCGLQIQIKGDIKDV